MVVNEMKQLLEVVPDTFPGTYRKDLTYFTTESAYTITGQNVSISKPGRGTRSPDPTKLTHELKGIVNGDCAST